MITLDQGGRARSSAQVFGPPPGLGDLVEQTTFLRAAALAGSGGWRVVPDTSGHLLVHRYRDGRVWAGVVGPRTRHIDVHQGERLWTVGVRFHPGALPAVTTTSAWELRDRGVALEVLYGAPGREATERLHGAECAAAAYELLVLLLRSMADRRVDWRARGFTAAIRRPGRGRVRDAAAAMGVGERTLRDVARDHLGLRPKEAARIARLHAALALGQAGTPDAVVACRAGYSDQAHYVHDHRRLLGETPGAFRARGRSPLRPARVDDGNPGVRRSS